MSDFGSTHTAAPACFPRQVCFLQVPLSGVAMEVWSCTCVHFHTLWRRGAGWRAAHLHLKQQALRLAALDRAVKSGSSPKHNRCSVKTPTSVMSCVQTHIWDWVLRWEPKNRTGIDKPPAIIFSYMSLSLPEFLWFSNFNPTSIKYHGQLSTLWWNSLIKIRQSSYLRSSAS